MEPTAVSDLTLTYILASIFLVVSLVGSIWLCVGRELEPDLDKVFFQIFLIFSSLFLTFAFLSGPFFSTGGYGMFEGNFSKISDVRQLVLLVFFAFSFLVTLFIIVFLPIMVSDAVKKYLTH